MIQSPLNYTGGKYKLLPQILPLFPKDIDVFVDLFAVDVMLVSMLIATELFIMI